MKETNPKILEQSEKLLQELKDLRGGTILDHHKRMANDPELLQAFIDQYKSSNQSGNQIPAKYKELMIMGMGAVRNMETTVKVHGSRAIALGATAEEIGEVYRAVFMLTGVSGLFSISEIFEPVDFE